VKPPDPLGVFSFGHPASFSQVTRFDIRMVDSLAGAVSGHALALERQARAAYGCARRGGAVRAPAAPRGDRSSRTKSTGRCRV